MLYLGQLCKVRNADDTVCPGIFLGFKIVQPSATKTALVAYLWEGKIVEYDFPLDSVSFIRFPHKNSLTGKGIVRGAFCKGIVNEHITLKAPDDNLLIPYLKEFLPHCK